MLIDFRRQQAIDIPLFVPVCRWSNENQWGREGGGGLRCGEFLPIIVKDYELLVGVKATIIFVILL